MNTLYLKCQKKTGECSTYHVSSKYTVVRVRYIYHTRQKVPHSPVGFRLFTGRFFFSNVKGLNELRIRPTSHICVEFSLKLRYKSILRVPHSVPCGTLYECCRCTTLASRGFDIFSRKTSIPRSTRFTLFREVENKGRTFHNEAVPLSL